MYFLVLSKEAWAPILAINCEHVSSEINPQFAQIADENDLVVVSRFVADLGRDVSGNMIWFIPTTPLSRFVICSAVEFRLVMAMMFLIKSGVPNCNLQLWMPNLK